MVYGNKCPRCGGLDKSFREVFGDKIIFRCNFCGEDFVVKDMEEGYLRQKVERLRQRYPKK